MQWQFPNLLVHRDHFIQVSLLIRKGGHWPPSAFLEDSHDQRGKWHLPGADRSGPGRGRQATGGPVSDGHDNLVAKAAKAMNLTVCKADGAAWRSWRRSCRVAGCTRPAVASYRRWGEACTSARRAIETRRSAGARRGRRSVRVPSSLPQACQPPGTTLLSATW